MLGGFLDLLQPYTKENKIKQHIIYVQQTERNAEVKHHNATIQTKLCLVHSV